MGTYPAQYPEAATKVAEHIIKLAVATRLVKQGGRWKSPYFFLTQRELIAIRQRFWTQLSDDELVRFIGLVFSKACPVVHYEFVSDGFELKMGGSQSRQTIVVGELRPCFHSYENSPREYAAAYKAVAALIDWRLSKASSWRDFAYGNKGGSDLIYGRLYQMIKTIGEFGYCRTHNVIRFIYASVPELHNEWLIAGLELRPVYHAENGKSRFTSLRLMPKLSA